jgi:hypothetical protein
MNLKDFNDESSHPEFIHKPDPQNPNAYQILHFKEDKRIYEIAGSYVKVDHSEEAEVTDKRIFNLMAVLNEKKRTFDFKSLTNSRTLFTLVPIKPEDHDVKVIFRTYDGDGVSKENAILSLDKGVFDDFS